LPGRSALEALDAAMLMASSAGGSPAGLDIAGRLVIGSKSMTGLTLLLLHSLA
jgi:hypothetical protein